MTPGGWIYVTAFGAALATAWVMTPVALRVAMKRNVLDHPGERKNHDSAVPYLGGIAIVLAFTLVLLIGYLASPYVRAASELPVILALAVGLSFLGLADDLRGVHPNVRLLIEVAAALGLWAAGIRISIFASDIANAAVLVVWIVGITNAMNLLDNMDGLSAGTAAIAAGCFFAIAALNGQFLVASLAAALAGCALGFLRHNFPPARIYMGDAGSLFIGFLLAVIGVRLVFNRPEELTFLVPILVLGVPIYDTLLVVAARIAHKRSPWIGGRDHISHRLVHVGIPVRAAVGLVYLAEVGLGWLALIVTRVDVATGYMIAGFVAAVALFLGALLYAVPVYENSRRRHMMIVDLTAHGASEETVTAPENVR